MTKDRFRTFDPARVPALAGWLATRLGAARVEIAEARRLSGGAVQENWRLAVVVEGGARAGRHDWVLRTDAAASLAVSLDRASEFAVLEAAHAAGVRVAEPLLRSDDAEVIGAPFLIQGFVTGVAQARYLVRDKDLARRGPLIAADFARELAKIHTIRPTEGRLSMLPIPVGSPALHEVARYRTVLDTAGEPRPALEYALAWLAANAPDPVAPALVHGDFRTGNLMVDGDRLSAVLDWEFAHWGDPDEDIGWLTAPCWRFGNAAMETGGLAPLQAFLDAYEQAAGRRVDPRRMAWWRILAAARWAAIAVLQGDRYRLGGEDSLEVALTGLMAAEIELDALDGIEAYEAGKPAP